MPKKPKEPPKPKIDKFKGTDREWIIKAAELAFSYAPTIYHCQHCNYPVAEGYCCQYCGSGDPGGEEADGESTHYLFSLEGVL